MTGTALLFSFCLRPAASIMASMGATGPLPQKISVSWHPASSRSSRAFSSRSRLQASSTSSSFWAKAVCSSLPLFASQSTVACRISSVSRPVCTPQSSSCTAACTARREEPAVPGITSSSITSRMGSSRTGWDSAAVVSGAAVGAGWVSAVGWVVSEAAVVSSGAISARIRFPYRFPTNSNPSNNARISTNSISLPRILIGFPFLWI